MSTPLTRRVVVALTCATVLASAACDQQGAGRTPSAPAGTSSAATPTVQATEALPVPLDPDARQVLRLAGDDSQVLELVSAAGAVAPGTAARAVPVRGGLADSAPYQSFTGPVQVELSAKPVQPLVLRGRAGSPQDVPVLWRYESAGWYAESVGEPGDFASTRITESVTVDAGSYAPADWGKAIAESLTTRTRQRTAAPVCAGPAPEWATVTGTAETLPTCLAALAPRDGRPVVQVRVVNARGVSVVATLPEGSEHVTVTGLGDAALKESTTYLGGDRLTLVPAGRQLTFEVPLADGASTLTLPLQTTPRSLLADVGAELLGAFAGVSRDEALVAGPVLAARCVATNPALVEPLPGDTGGLTSRVNAMAQCVAAAVAGPASRDEAGLALAAARLGRPAAEVGGDSRLGPDVRRGRGLLLVAGALATRVGGLGEAAPVLADAAADSAATTVRAGFQSDQMLCGKDEQGCTVQDLRPDIDGDGKADTVAFARTGDRTVEVRVLTAAGHRSGVAMSGEEGVGEPTLTGAPRIDGAPGSELVVRHAGKEGDGTTFFTALTWRDGALTGMPLPQQDGNDVALAVLDRPGDVVGWTITARQGLPALAREWWHPAGRDEDGDAGWWTRVITYWVWSGAGWRQESENTASGDEDMARRRATFFAPGISSR